MSQILMIPMSASRNDCGSMKKIPVILMGEWEKNAIYYRQILFTHTHYENKL